MKKILVILLLCVAAATAMMAQKTLSGTILSKTDGAPVEMATVRLFTYNGTEEKFFQTSFHLKFQFTLVLAGLFQKLHQETTSRQYQM